MTCRLFRSLNTSFLFTHMNLRKIRNPPSFNWLFARTQCSRSLILKGTRYTQRQVLDLVQNCSGSLQTLDLSFYTVEAPHLRQVLSNLHSLRHLVLAGCKLKDKALYELDRLPNLCVLNIDYNSSLRGFAFKDLDTRLSSLSFEGCQNIEVSSVAPLIQRSSETMTELRIDGEHWDTQGTVELLQLLPGLSKLSVAFSNEMGDMVLETLCGLSWEVLRLRKGVQFSHLALESVFSTWLPLLRYLDLSECYDLEDSTCVLISLNCPQLTHFYTFWCSKVEDNGIRSVVLNCEFLKVLGLTGLKSLTEGAFPLIEPVKSYDSLKELNVSQCDSVSDRHLWELHYRYPRMRILNYYGEPHGAWKAYENCK